MSTDNPNLYGAMNDAVEGSRDELALYGFTCDVQVVEWDQEPIIWVEIDDKGLPGFTSSRTFDNVPEFEKWASETIDAHREVTA